MCKTASLPCRGLCLSNMVHLEFDFVAEALDATAGTALLQRGPRALRGHGVLKA